MNGIHAVRIAVYRTHMRHGKRHAVKFLDLLVPWPLKQEGGQIGYGPDLSDGFSDSIEYGGTYQFIQQGVYQFNLPEGVTGHGVKQYGGSGIVTLQGLYPSAHHGSHGAAEVRGAGVDAPPGVRWRVEHGYKRLGEL
jgi:hypothetical protein